MADVEEEDGIQQPESKAMEPPDMGEMAQRQGLDGHVRGQLHFVKEVSLALPTLALLQLVCHKDACSNSDWGCQAPLVLGLTHTITEGKGTTPSQHRLTE